MRAKRIAQTGKHAKESEVTIMGYIHGDKGYTILGRQNILLDKREDYFCEMLW